MFSLYIFLVFYNLPTFFEITTVKDPDTNATIIAGTSLRKNMLYFAIYKVYAKIAIDLFAYIVIIVLNTAIFIKGLRIPGQWLPGVLRINKVRPVPRAIVRGSLTKSSETEAGRAVSCGPPPDPSRIETANPTLA